MYINMNCEDLHLPILPNIWNGSLNTKIISYCCHFILVYVYINLKIFFLMQCIQFNIIYVYIYVHYQSLYAHVYWFLCNKIWIYKHIHVYIYCTLRGDRRSFWLLLPTGDKEYGEESLKSRLLRGTWYWNTKCHIQFWKCIYIFMYLKIKITFCESCYVPISVKYNLN